MVQNFKAHYGVLMPAALLTFLTIYFLWLNYTTWENVKYTWPNFLLAPASGLFALYIANREKGLLIPVCVLAALAVIFLRDYFSIRHNSWNCFPHIRNNIDNFAVFQEEMKVKPSLYNSKRITGTSLIFQIFHTIWLLVG
jgi:hypothetical protein